MFKFIVNKISDSEIEVYVIDTNGSKLTNTLVLTPEQCLEFSNLLMDSAEDLLRCVDLSVVEILDNSPDKNMIN